jgi:predicted ester cyclase
VVHRFYEEIWNQGALDAAPSICHSDMTFRGSLGPEKCGIEPFLDYVRYVRGALADYQCATLDIVSDDDRAFAKMLFRGRHVGEFEGFAPTDRLLTWHGAALFTVANSRIRDLWVLGDRHALCEQLQSAS